MEDPRMRINRIHHLVYSITLSMMPSRRSRIMLVMQAIKRVFTIPPTNFFKVEYGRQFKSRNLQVENSVQRIKTPSDKINSNKISTKFMSPYFSDQPNKKRNTNSLKSINSFRSNIRLDLLCHHLIRIKKFLFIQRSRLKKLGNLIKDNRQNYVASKNIIKFFAKKKTSGNTKKYCKKSNIVALIKNIFAFALKDHLISPYCINIPQILE